jgi:hypothetical protein
LRVLPIELTKKNTESNRRFKRTKGTSSKLRKAGSAETLPAFLFLRATASKNLITCDEKLH